MRALLVASAVLILAAPVFAGTIDFESTGVSVGAPLPTIDIVSFGGAILGDYLGTDHEGFRSNAAGNDDALFSYAGYGTYFLADAYGVNPTGGADFGIPTTVTLTFSKPVTNVSMWFSDVNQNMLEWVTVVISDGGGFSDSITLREPTNGAGDGKNALMDFANATPITSMVITSGADTPANRAGWGLDNLCYTAISSTSVPVPAAAWLGLGLLGLLGAARRLRRR